MSIVDKASSVAAATGGGVIPAGQAAALAEESGTSLEQLMLDLIPLAKD